MSIYVVRRGNMPKVDPYRYSGEYCAES